MYLYVAILPEHAQLAEDVLGPWSGEIIEGLAIYADLDATWGTMSYTEDHLQQLGIAFNMGMYHKAADYSPNSMSSFRTDHAGVEIPHIDSISISVDADQTRRQLLHKQLDLQTRDIDRIANVLYLRDGWEHQVEYGKLYRMMRLIGANE